MDSEVQSEALLNFLSSGDFRDAIDGFFGTQCRYFKDSSVVEGSLYSHRQYSIWKDFQELVEVLIDSALQSIGGSIESLEKELTIVLEREPTGPRQALRQSLIRKLLSYHRYSIIVDVKVPNDE
jgi:hypothetical protein